MQTAARPQTGARPPGTAPMGCYKCGQTGHWARDCPAPPSQWIPRQPQAGGQGRTPSSGPGAGAPPAAGENDPLNPDAAAAADGAQAAGQTAAALKKEKRKRPKLTLELLQSSKGMPDVLVNFPDAFRRQFKGRGHEASDLRRLLEMYKRWQDRVFPHGDFDSFIGNVERLSGTCALRHEVHELRMRLLREVQDIADPPHVQLEDAEPSPGVAVDGEAPQALRGAAAALGDDDDDMELQLEHPEEMDDELMGLLMDPAEGAGPAARPAGAAAIGGAAAAAAAADEDDGLMELIDEEEEEQPAGQQAPQVPQQGFAEEEDDELMQLLEESENVEPAAHVVHAVVTAGAAGGQQAMATEAGAAATEGPAATTATAAAAAAEEERQLAALADDGLLPSQSVLPGSTLPGGGAAAAFSAGMAAGAADEAAVGSEEDALLALLEEEDGQPAQQAQQAQQGGTDGSSGASQLPLVQPSPEFGAFPLTAADAQPPASQAHGVSQAVGAATATAGGSQAAVGSEEEEAAAAGLASPVLGPDTEVEGAFPPESFVPESEPISDPTQEL